MNSNDTAPPSLERRLAALDPEIPPGRDLWLDIEAAIGASVRGDAALEQAPVEAGPIEAGPIEAGPGAAGPGAAAPSAPMPSPPAPASSRPIKRSRAARAQRWPLALAAGFAAVAIVGALVGWQLARLKAPTVAALPTVPPAAIAAPGEGSESGGSAVPDTSGGFEVPETKDFAATRTSLQRTYAQRLALLAPTTRRRVEQDMATIQAANADIRKALAADPQSAVLNHLLASTLQQEFDLYSTVIRNTAPSVPRNPS